jgi:hypothetical protein
MAIFKPPHNIASRDNKKSIFLAGSIEMGKAEDWQTNLANYFNDNNWNVFNPRRDDWDSSWTQEFENPQFYQQVNWELNALEQSDAVVMYFAQGTQSPISLLEMGLYAESGKLSVICPDGFWRKGNVEIVCNYYNISFSNTIEEFLEKIKL